MDDKFKDFSKEKNLLKIMGELNKGNFIYDYKLTYDIIKEIFESNDEEICLNYGYWPEGINTKKANFKLVDKTLESLDIKKSDNLLNVGSGMGGPDLHILNKYNPARINGINISQKQVEFSRYLFFKSNVEERIGHICADAKLIGSLYPKESLDHAFSIEALTEVSKSEEALGGIYKVLKKGGKLSFCDVVATPENVENNFKLKSSRLLYKLDEVLFNNQFRGINEYENSLKEAGFENITYESIGKEVFPFFYEKTKDKIRDLKDAGIPAAWRMLTKTDVGVLNKLNKNNYIDYVVFTAEKV